MYKGDLEGFPKEVVEKMLERQVEQGNEKDVSVFEGSYAQTGDCGGFFWKDTIEGYGFWSEVLSKRNFNLFFNKYPKEAKKEITLEYVKEYFKLAKKVKCLHDDSVYEIDMSTIHYNGMWYWVNDLKCMNSVQLTDDNKLAEIVEYRTLEDSKKELKNFYNELDDSKVEQIKKKWEELQESINKPKIHILHTNKPKRYSSREVAGMDVIDLVKHWNLDFNEGNILKYLLRDKGEDIQDLEKIIDYAQRQLEFKRNEAEANK